MASKGEFEAWKARRQEFIHLLARWSFMMRVLEQFLTDLFFRRL